MLDIIFQNPNPKVKSGFENFLHYNPHTAPQWALFIHQMGPIWSTISLPQPQFQPTDH